MIVITIWSIGLEADGEIVRYGWLQIISRLDLDWLVCDLRVDTQLAATLALDGINKRLKRTWHLSNCFIWPLRRVFLAFCLKDLTFIAPTLDSSHNVSVSSPLATGLFISTILLLLSCRRLIIRNEESGVAIPYGQTLRIKRHSDSFFCALSLPHFISVELVVKQLHTCDNLCVWNIMAEAGVDTFFDVAVNN